MSEIRYVEEVPPDNWLLVRLASNERISLPYGVKVEFTARTDRRDNFKILEGVHKGKSASVSEKSPTTSYLVSNVRHLPSGNVEFDLKSQAVKFGNLGPFNAFSGGGYNGFTPVAAGRYALAIPAFPTAQTRSEYSQWTRLHRSWFRIGTDLSGSRFLHPGQISDGCVTVRAFIYDGAPGASLPNGFSDLPGFVNGPAKGLLGLPLPARRAPVVGYDELYRYLILRRGSDLSVGTLTVTDTGRL